MRHILLTVFLLSAALAYGQNTSGQIVFLEKMKLEMKFEGADAERFKAMMPSERKSKFQLTFNEDVSLYQSYEGGAEDDEKEMSWTSTTSEGEAVVKVQFAQPDNKYFTHIKEKRKVNKQEFMGKNFLITGNSDELKWKLAGEQKEILGYRCMKATLQDTSRNVTAWFTTEIPVSTGPGEFSGLPGMILEVIIDENRSILANKIEFREVSKEDLSEPTRGKSVSVEEFRAIQKEKMEEMKEMGGNRRIMVIEHQ